MRIIAELKRLVETKRDELSKLEAALDVLTGRASFELKHSTGKEAEKPTPKSKRQYRRKRVVMPAGHYEAIIGSMLHAKVDLEVTAKDVVTYARRQGAHASKSAVQAILTRMAGDGWLVRCGMRVREVLYRRAVMEPARWSTLYKEEGDSRR